MKKVIWIIVAASILLSGCIEQSNEQLMKLKMPVSDFAAKWIEEYGESEESIKNYNTVLVRERLNTEILKIEELTKRVDELEIRTETWGTVLEKMSQPEKE
jgi:hypothetical protein